MPRLVIVRGAGVADQPISDRLTKFWSAIGLLLGGCISVILFELRHATCQTLTFSPLGDQLVFELSSFVSFTI
jgi:hypothetical protein